MVLRDQSLITLEGGRWRVEGGGWWSVMGGGWWGYCGGDELGMITDHVLTRLDKLSASSRLLISSWCQIIHRE